MRAMLPLVLAACSSAPPAATPSSPVFASERGFVDLGTRHVFYTLFSADADPARKPLFVLFNGGPGAPTTLGLIADTAPMAVDPNGAVFPNPNSYTQLGSLLFIDQPLSGFSYDDAPAAMTGFDMAADAADFTRVIVRALDAHPEIAASQVVLVGESYGGARAALVLDDLFDYTAHPELADDVQRHLDAIFPAAPLHPAEEIATQFFAQVLIEPLVVGAYQIAASRARGSLAVSVDNVVTALSDPAAGTALLGGRLEDISGLAGPDRHGTPRNSSFASLELAFEARLGPLDPGDAYFANGPFSVTWSVDTMLVPPAFVRDLGRVRTFITHALDDGIIDATAIAPGLGTMGIPATIDPTVPADAARPGEIVVELPGGEVAIRFPSYDATHQVTRTQAGALRADIADWLK